MESIRHFLDQALDFWWLVVTPTLIWLLQWVARWAGGRVVKSYEDQIKHLNERMEALEKKDLLPRKEALQVVEAVQKEHEKIAAAQRENFKHLENRIDDMMTRIYDIIRDKH